MSSDLVDDRHFTRQAEQAEAERNGISAPDCARKILASLERK
ncbi:hypothetical protein [Rhodococcus sp. KBS0724]|jgi:hypothetical protein|nr:hypothetical protein [Rhodococcus sp. KBS0724]